MTVVSVNPALMTNRKYHKKNFVSIVLRDGHYEMASPLKDHKAPVPNNKPQVKQCTFWLKGKLQHNKDLYSKYKCFVAEIIDKGYVSKVPADLLESSSKK